MRLKEYRAWLIESHVPGLLLLVAYSLFLFWPIPFTSSTLASEDILNQFYPWTKFWVSELKAGDFPLWNPYSFCGTPFIGNWQAAYYYPPQFLFSLLSPLKCFGWTLLFHTFFAGAAMYFLLHYLTRNKIVSAAMGIAYMSSGFLITRINAGHITILNEIPWVPLAVLFYLMGMERPSWKTWALLVLVFAFQILGGQPQITYLTIMLLGFLFVGEAIVLYKKDKPSLLILLKPLGVLLLALGMALLITCIYWLPCYEFNQASAMRSAGLDYKEATWGSLSFKQLALFITPFLYGDVTGREFWGIKAGDRIPGTLWIPGNRYCFRTSLWNVWTRFPQKTNMDGDPVFISPVGCGFSYSFLQVVFLVCSRCPVFSSTGPVFNALFSLRLRDCRVWF